MHPPECCRPETDSLPYGYYIVISILKDCGSRNRGICELTGKIHAEERYSKEKKKNG
jgi:hypothetical protein